MKSISLQNCNSINDVVLLINQGGSSELTDIEHAAEYVIDCCNDQKDLSMENAEAHLDILIEAGAKVNFQEVVKEIEKLKAKI